MPSRRLPPLAPARVLLGAVMAAALVASAPADAAKKKATKAAQASPPPYAEREDVRRFAAEAAERHGLDRAWIERQLRAARYLPSVTRLIMPPPAGTAKNWAAYRARFVEPQRIGAGVAFWQQHRETLARAEQQYGVPASLVVGIIGVETFFGRITGDFRAVDALATLAFDFPSGRSDRSAFFRDELEQLLLWTSREDLDPLGVRGSFAGAIGLPQFMPSSINRFAVDFDGDGHVDLRGSAADAIGSVARFLAEHGWMAGLPTHYAVTPPDAEIDRAVLLVPDIVPSFTAAQFAERGAELDDAGRRHDGLLALVALDNGDAPRSFVAGTQNFFVVTRYNRSSYYALAVIELGAAIASERGADVDAAR